MKVTLEQELKKSGMHISTTSGISMYPMLRDRMDVIIVVPDNKRLHRYDVALYKRPDGNYVLHRILSVRENDYIVCGDNCIVREVVPDGWILGVLQGFYRGGRYIELRNIWYRLYVHLWCDLFYLRIIILKGWRFLKKIGRN